MISNRFESTAGISSTGGIRSTTNIDVAVEHGAKFIVVINPVVPFVNDSAADPHGHGHAGARVSDMGFTAIGNQAFRLLSTAPSHRGQHWEERYPPAWTSS